MSRATQANGLGTERPIAPAALALLTAGMLGGGCGHPATEQECMELFDRSAAIELEHQNVTDPGLVRERIEQAREDRGEDLMRKCVGRRITDRAMRCVRRATTTKDLDACLM